MTLDSHRPVITSRADVGTDTPDRYAKQLIAHLGRKLDFSTKGATSTTTIGAATGQIIVGAGRLTLVATGHDEYPDPHPGPGGFWLRISGVSPSVTKKLANSEGATAIHIAAVTPWGYVWSQLAQATGDRRR